MLKTALEKALGAAIYLVLFPHHLYWLLREPPGASTLTPGSWQVRYPDGAITVRMPYGNAVGYRKLFGGEVFRKAP